MGFPGGLALKNPPAIQELQETVLILGSERSLGGGHGNPLQYSCLENPMDRGAWWAMVHRVTKELDTTEHQHLDHFILDFSKLSYFNDH